MARDPASIAQIGQSLRDERVGGVVALDVGLARGFTPASPASVSIPVLLIEPGRRAAGRPMGWYGRYVAASLPAGGTTYREIADAGHFSFMPECQPGAVAILKAEQRGDEIVCTDGGGRDRRAIHAETAELIEQFLQGCGIRDHIPLTLDREGAPPPSWRVRHMVDAFLTTTKRRRGTVSEAERGPDRERRGMGRSRGTGRRR